MRLGYHAVSEPVNPNRRGGPDPPRVLLRSAGPVPRRVPPTPPTGSSNGRIRRVDHLSLCTPTRQGVLVRPGLLRVWDAYPGPPHRAVIPTRHFPDLAGATRRGAPGAVGPRYARDEVIASARPSTVQYRHPRGRGPPAAVPAPPTLHVIPRRRGRRRPIRAAACATSFRRGPTISW